MCSNVSWTSIETNHLSTHYLQQKKALSLDCTGLYMHVVDYCALCVHSNCSVAAALIARKPGIISLAGGAPNPSLFPFKEIDIKLR